MRAGYLSFRADGKTLEISKLYLLPEFRGSGLSSLAMEYIMESGRSEGCSAAELVVNPYNSRAIAFYAKHGFEEVRRIPEEGIGRPEYLSVMARPMRVVKRGCDGSAEGQDMQGNGKEGGQAPRAGDASDVYFTRDLSPEGLKKVFERVRGTLKGRICVKVHTGEAEGPNIIPRPWIRELISESMPGAHIAETNTYYEGDRYTTESHRETLRTNGWTFCPVDIADEDGAITFPVEGGKWFREMHVGKGFENYDSMVVLTHFKGHDMGGFGGSNKNIGIGCADGRIGKKEIHTAEGSSDMWSITGDELMERMTESAKSVVDHFSPGICFVNVMRNMSVSCDCEGTMAEPVVTPDIGIAASLDILAADMACVDIVYSLPENGGKEMVERIESRGGLRQLSYMKELGMGSGRYRIIDIDNGDAVITAEEAAEGIAPGWRPDRYNTFPGRNEIRKGRRGSPRSFLSFSQGFPYLIIFEASPKTPMMVLYSYFVGMARPIILLNIMRVISLLFGG